MNSNQGYQGYGRLSTCASRQLPTWALAFVLCLLVPGLPALGLTPRQASANTDAHTAAIHQARAGEHAAALKALRGLIQKSPHDLALRYDYLVVLGWAGRDDEVLKGLSGLDLAPAPPFALDAFARSARNLGRQKLAAKLYRRVLFRYPGRPASTVGLALSLAGMGQTDAALESLAPVLRARPALPDALEAKALIEEQREDWTAALAAWNQLAEIADDKRPALRGQVRVVARLGGAYRATQLARDPNTGLAGGYDDSLRADRAAVAVRWGRAQLPIRSGDARFVWIDRALAESEAVADRLSRATPIAAPKLAATGNSLTIATAIEAFDGHERRLLADRLVALSMRRRSDDVIVLYTQMNAARIDTPPYAAAAVADALLEKRQPEQAEPLFRIALGAAPDEPDIVYGLFYALNESNRHDEAIALIDDFAARQKPRLPGGAPNYEIATARALAVKARAWSGYTRDASEKFAALNRAAPANGEVRHAGATLAQARARPREAEQELRRTLAVDPANVSVRADHVETLIDTQRWVLAKAQLDELLRRHPDSEQVQRAARTWENHERAQIELESGRSRSEDNSPAIGRDWFVGLRAYAPPINSYWRPYLRLYRAHGEFTGGVADWHREGAGLEYRRDDYRVAAELSTGSNGITGTSLRGRWTFNDDWWFEGNIESIAEQTLLQAWQSGVRASEFGLRAGWTPNESRRASVGLTRYHFTDDNNRLAWYASWTERFISTPSWRIDATIGAWQSTNSLLGAPYFNPERDRSLTLEIAAEWTSWRRYERALRHRFTATGGNYWQHGFGSGGITGLRYEAIFDYDRRLSVSLGIGRLVRPYDGIRTGSSYLQFLLDWRFL
ncbi:MAG: poly-beta-1,6 N-acetyl-D-glucosamine export porin PgaA [Burkholderiaceae bacterium]